MSEQMTPGQYRWSQAAPIATEMLAILLPGSLGVATTQAQDERFHTLSWWWEGEGWEHLTFGGIEQRGPATDPDAVFYMLLLTINATITILQHHCSPWMSLSGIVPSALPGQPAVPIPWYRFGFQLRGRPVIGGQRVIWARVRDLQLVTIGGPGHPTSPLIPWEAMEWRPSS